MDGVGQCVEDAIADDLSVVGTEQHDAPPCPTEDGVGEDFGAVAAHQNTHAGRHGVTAGGFDGGQREVLQGDAVALHDQGAAGGIGGHKYGVLALNYGSGGGEAEGVVVHPDAWGDDDSLAGLGGVEESLEERGGIGLAMGRNGGKQQQKGKQKGEQGVHVAIMRQNRAC